MLAVGFEFGIRVKFDFRVASCVASDVAVLEADKLFKRLRQNSYAPAQPRALDSGG